MRKPYINIILVVLSACNPIALFSQTGLVNMNRTFDFELESKMNQSDSNFHTSIKPYTISSLSSGNINIEEGGASFFFK